MKKVIAAALIAIASSSAIAEKTYTAYDVCEGIGRLAETVMTGRQKETPMSSMMKLAEGPEKEVTRSIIITAYERFAYRTPANQKRSIAKFKNDVYLICVKKIATKD